MFEIIPSPGTTDHDFAGIEKKLNSIIPPARTIHIDVIDGIFAPNTTFSDPGSFAKYIKALPLSPLHSESGETRFVFEVHLMVMEPINYLQKFADAGFTRFIGQVEKMSDQAKFVTRAQEIGDAALALDLGTPLSDLKVSLLDLDSILIMSVKAGHSGQEFNHEALEKVRELKNKFEIPIEIDGGINDKTILPAYEAGASRFVATSFLFNSEKSPKEQFRLLESVTQSSKA